MMIAISCLAAAGAQALPHLAETSALLHLAAHC